MNGLRLGKNIPVEYSDYIWNGKCEDEEATYELEIWAKTNEIELDME